MPKGGGCNVSTKKMMQRCKRVTDEKEKKEKKEKKGEEKRRERYSTHLQKRPPPLLTLTLKKGVSAAGAGMRN